MPHVPYPPGGFIKKKGVTNFNTCVEYVNDPLTITFVDPGMIFPTAAGVFSPDIPFGVYKKGETIGPYLPVRGQKGLIVYFGDLTNLKMYTNTIILCTKCNSTTAAKCA
jgi:hypothetical protein